MAKKLFAMLLAVLMVLTCFCSFASNEKKTYKIADVTEFGSEAKTNGEYFAVRENQSWFGIKGVDLTGVKSIGITGKNPMGGSQNAETFRIKIDDPMAESIGFIAFNETSEDGSDVTVRGNIGEKSGTHDLYFVTTLTKNAPAWEIKEITLYTDTVVRETVSDDNIIDTWSDTWVAVDDFGRKVADYEEAGPVKEGERTVAMMYWIWNSVNGTDKNYNIVIPDVIRKDPAAKYDSYSDSWFSINSKMWWGEPVMGFYTSEDFWVYKRHAILLADAGVDVIFFDFTNSALTMTKNLKVLMEAYLEAKSEGVNVPKISSFGGMSESSVNIFDELSTLYFNVLQDDRYKDLWFEWEGKPFTSSWPVKKMNVNKLNMNDADIVKLRDTIDDTFNYRHHRTGAADADHNDISWIDEYPQQLRGKIREDGRVESVTLAMAVNRSTIYGLGEVGVFSDQYAMDKGYSKAFGEEYDIEWGARKGYFLREMEGMVLEVDPTFVFVDGWNEWNTPLNPIYGRYKCAFIDLFDEAGSRDFEPSRSYLKDDYYNMLVDFVRKYKGVRPAPVAGEAVTINMNGSASQWDNVTPEFYNSYADYERDELGYRDTETGERIHYTTKVNNSIIRAKAARDTENLYFMAKTTRPVAEGEGFMNLYINSDRNAATGWNGYDYAVNRNGRGTVAKYENGAWTTIGSAEIKIENDVLWLSVARGLIGVPGTVDIEFKWTDGFVTDDYLDFYTEGSVAPTGKFNYLFTELQQVSLSASERAALKGTSVLKAGSGKMVVSGGKMNVYEADTRITPFEANGTLYVPADTWEELLGFGLSKVKYDSEDNILYIARHDLDIELEDTENRGAEITNYVWTYNVLGSAELRVNGELNYLSAPLTVKDGIIYVPLTYASEAFGWTYKSLGNGAYMISQDGASDSAVSAALNIIG